MTIDDVRAFSATIADKFAVKASEGIPSVVKSIEAALAGAREMASTTPVNAAKERLVQLAGEIQDETRTQRMLSGSEGALFLRTHFDKIFEQVVSAIKEYEAASQFQFKVIARSGPTDTPVIRLECPYKLLADIVAVNLFGNDATRCTLDILMCRMHLNVMREYNGRSPISKTSFKPVVNSANKVRWIGKDRDVGDDEIAGVFLNVLVDQLILDKKNYRPKDDL